MNKTRPRLLYIVTEDWFFCSHFLPIARAAQVDGFDVSVACRERDHGELIRAEGFRVLPVEADRKTLNPLAILTSAMRLRRVIAEEKPDIVHLIALRSVIVGGLAAMLAGVRRRVIALTGMGLLGAADNLRMRFARFVVRHFIRRVVDGRSAHFIFENRANPLLLRLKPDDQSKVTIVGGAGVDPEVYTVAPLPPFPPLRVALISRMLWSKGIDVAVEAIRKARAAGADVTLSLYGAPDPANPKSIKQELLQEWAKEPGVEWYGKIAQSDVPAVWADHHMAILPSRGGEGLPRGLLEAAACGRAIITTNVPGCRDLVRHGLEGYVVSASDAQAIASVLIAVAKNPSQIQTMAEAAHARVLDGFTEADVSSTVAAVYQNMLKR
jgi:glycosyltransferase involved in cell wall biosynthesis